jgi:hypothetical protein
LIQFSLTQINIKHKTEEGIMVRRINKAAVIGSGIMGGGIAALLAAAGVDVLLLDIVPFDLKEEEKKDPKARNRIVTMGLEGATKAKPPLFYSKDHAMRISTGNLEDDFDKLKECDWIIEPRDVRVRCRVRGADGQSLRNRPEQGCSGALGAQSLDEKPSTSPEFSEVMKEFCATLATAHA